MHGEISHMCKNRCKGYPGNSYYMNIYELNNHYS